MHFNIPCQAHELTFSCYNKLPLFSFDEACITFLKHLSIEQHSSNFDLWAYVIMPTHVHLLIWFNSDDYSIEKLLKNLKGRFSLEYGQWLSLKCPEKRAELISDNRFRFWTKGGGFDRSLFNSKPIHSSIRYIENNPVRAGLVRSAGDWKWSSAWNYIESSPIHPKVDWANVSIIML